MFMLTSVQVLLLDESRFVLLSYIYCIPVYMSGQGVRSQEAPAAAVACASARRGHIRMLLAINRYPESFAADLRYSESLTYIRLTCFYLDIILHFNVTHYSYYQTKVYLLHDYTSIFPPGNVCNHRLFMPLFQSLLTSWSHRTSVLVTSFLVNGLSCI